MHILTFGLILFGASQVYWAWRGYRLASRHIRTRGRRWAAIGVALGVYLGMLAWNLRFGWRRPTPVQLTVSDALLVAPFLWWAVSSLAGFFIALPFEALRGISRALPKRRVSADRNPSASALNHNEPPGQQSARHLQARTGLVQPIPAQGAPRRGSDAHSEPRPSGSGRGGGRLTPRREFLGRTGAVAASAPFVAGAYGLLYGRLNLETPEHTVSLAGLPKAFDGFRIAQLSDIHIGPFMPASQIRSFVEVANALRPDLVALTGDFVILDPRTAPKVVEALSGLRAPFGVFGCLGNHEEWVGVEDSIGELFRLAGVRILRGQAVPVSTGGEWFQLIGVDFQSHRRFGSSAPVARILGNVEGLIAPGRANILLSHNPDTFDYAAEMGIGLSLAGHTHGGQLALEFISPQIAPSRLVTPYVAGWFRKPGGLLYVNRGIGTIGVPIRVGAPPEITVFRLKCG